jgi:hypothetical protein
LNIPTKEQEDKLKEIQSQGYKFDKQLSVSSAAVIMVKGQDIWLFGLDGSIAHNPEVAWYIKCF